MMNIFQGFFGKNSASVSKSTNMSSLLEKIRSLDQKAASILEEADFTTDSDIQSLTQQELCDMLPGPVNLKLRRSIYAKIQEHDPVDALIKQLKDFIPHESLRAALTQNGVLVGYLPVLKDIKAQMGNVLDFVDAHIKLLEEFSEEKPEWNYNKGSSSGTGASGNSGALVLFTGQPGGIPRGEQGHSADTGLSGANGQLMVNEGPTGDQQQQSHKGFTMLAHEYIQEDKVIVQVMVSGQTFGAHKQLMDKVLNDQAMDGIIFVENSDRHMVTILFCPICSRIGSDVEAAMSDVKDNKPVVLVLMHHEREPKYTSSSKTWYHCRDPVLIVNVFYHETMNGLLQCHQNENAVHSIRKQVLEYKYPTSQYSSRNAQGVGGDNDSAGKLSKCLRINKK